MEFIYPGGLRNSAGDFLFPVVGDDCHLLGFWSIEKTQQNLAWAIIGQPPFTLSAQFWKNWHSEAAVSCMPQLCFPGD